ncbi:unnamed protein product [Adineta steineri]|uniref:SGNH hydrolase-type esterase domain-containing protein n=1 Tax=Adineta steineri TaxID=433720 RepID=A0A814LRK6_9BILA|nr:unnamed protein product [Adineta steineri]CAF1068288.1 unnamed protein product [Adineta steineri]CAF3699756.1 unnamed protein product [Adineta steineri]CAF3901420.1 unnamed protein product [Adineta steineri]
MRTTRDSIILLLLVLESESTEHGTTAALFSHIRAGVLFINSNEDNSGQGLLALGDSFTSGGGLQSYPHVAANLLNWQVGNFAVGGSKTTDIWLQLLRANSVLHMATHVVLTIGGNDLEGLQSLAGIAQLNMTLFEERCANFKPKLVSTYKQIKSSLRADAKFYALPYVDFVSVGNKIPYEAESHRVMQTMNNLVRNAAIEANVNYVDTIVSAFLGHEMYSTDSYIDDFSHPTNPLHPNLKGYAKIGEVLAAYLLAN